jgi:hypothetical protein
MTPYLYDNPLLFFTPFFLHIMSPLTDRRVSLAEDHRLLGRSPRAALKTTGRASAMPLSEDHRLKTLSEDLYKQDTNKFSSPPALTESWLRPLSKLVKINTVLDMTAYIGSETIVASQVLPHAHITACEMNEDTF